MLNTVARLLKERTVKPEKQPLLANGSETTFVSRQRPRNNGTKSVARQQILCKRQLNSNIGTMFSAQSVPRCYNQDGMGQPVSCKSTQLKERL
jgi:hypothetical protein